MFGALILAGGASRRMGRDKAWLQLQGQPLLLHVLARIMPICERVIVAAAPGQVLPELPAGVTRVDDPPELQGRGPLVGMMIGLSALADAGIELAYLSSCDAAGLSRAHVQFMLDRLALAAMAHAEALVPRDEHGLHPLAAALRTAPALARARTMVAHDQRRLLEWAAGWPTIDAGELPDPGVLAPCNDPEQWRTIVEDHTPA